MFGGGVNMREAQIYIEKHYKKKKIHQELGGCGLSTGGEAPPVEEKYHCSLYFLLAMLIMQDIFPCGVSIRCNYHASRHNAIILIKSKL